MIDFFCVSMPGFRAVRRLITVGLLAATLVMDLFTPAGARVLPSRTHLVFNYGSDARFERLTVEDGLPSSTVLGVLQDQQGFMWFATADGLARYDGYQFKIFRHDPENPNSLSQNNIFALIETRDGLLWIGTDPGGLNVYNPKTSTFKSYRHDPQNPSSLPNDSIWSLLEAQDGSIWVGTRAGLSHFYPETGTFKNYLHDPQNPRSLAAPWCNAFTRTAPGRFGLAHALVCNATTRKPMTLQPSEMTRPIQRRSRPAACGLFWKIRGGIFGWGRVAAA